MKKIAIIIIAALLLLMAPCGFCGYQETMAPDEATAATHDAGEEVLDTVNRDMEEEPPAAGPDDSWKKGYEDAIKAIAVYDPGWIEEWGAYRRRLPGAAGCPRWKRSGRGFTVHSACCPVAEGVESSSSLIFCCAGCCAGINAPQTGRRKLQLSLGKNYQS